jgi:uroporphyrinogen decarboxylase
MNHRKRMETCLQGDTPDRTPVALWRHFPVDDMTPQGLADAHLHFQRSYDFDFLKVTPPSGYFLYDWGVEDEWQGNHEGTRVYTRRVVHSPGDWEKLPPLDPSQGTLGGQLKALKTITNELGPNTPVIQTIFNPLSLAKKLVGDEVLFTHMREHPEKLHKGMEILLESSREFVKAVVNETGVAGIFFATQHAQAGMLTWEEYEVFGRQYDLPLLEEAQSLWLNVLHLHGEDVFFEQLANYPVNVINWHDMETEPNLSKGKEIFSGVVCGGIRQWDTLALGTSEQVKSEAREAIKATRGERFILGTGCVSHIITPHGNLMAARKVVEEDN